MDNSLEHIKFLLKKYQDRKQELIEELEQLDDKLSAINKTFELLQQEGLVQEEKLTTPLQLSHKYAGMKKKDAILDVLNSDPEKQWKCNEIVDLLRVNGFKSASKNLLRDVYAELNRLNKEEKIEILKGRRKGKGTRYKSKKKDAPVFQRKEVGIANP